jgi:lipoprotein signal peptidase
VLGTLLRYTGWLLVIALLILLIAVITGPYPWAMRIRAWTAAVAAAAVGAVRDRQPSTEVTWVAEHRDVLMLAGAGVGVLLLLFTSLSLVGSLVLIVVFGVYELVIYRAGAVAG